MGMGLGLGLGDQDILGCLLAILDIPMKGQGGRFPLFALYRQNPGVHCVH